MMLLPLLLCGFPLVSFAQKPQSACFSGSGTSISPISSAFQQCNFLDKTLNSCSALPNSGQLGCLCKQNVFNAIIGCENEDIECLDSDKLNKQANGLKSIWHSKCDNYVTFDVTTPKISSLTTTTGVQNNAAFCTYALSLCAAATASLDACASSFPISQEPSRFSSCACNDAILSANSVCEYDFNKTCLGVPAATSKIVLWNECPAQVSKFLATRVTTTSNLPNSLAPLTLGPASSKTSAGTAKATGPVATGANKNAAVSIQVSSWGWLWLAVAGTFVHWNSYS